MVDASAEEISNTSENNIFVRLSPNIEACTSKQYVPDCNLKLLSFLGRRKWWFATIPVSPTKRPKIGRAHVRTPVTNAQRVCRILPEQQIIYNTRSTTRYHHLHHNT